MRRSVLVVLVLVCGIAGAILVWRPWLSPLQRLVRWTHSSGVKVLLVGIDGASFRVMEPLLAEGRLPRFKSLMERGAHGVLKSESPTTSPALWTTIATGRSRKAHGITGFVTYKDPREKKHGTLVGSSDRKTLALWNLASVFGLEVGFLGWWASWPAEPVKGWIVSDRATRERWNEWAGGAKDAHLTFPESLTRELQPFVVDPMTPPMDVVEDLVRFTPQERAEFLAVRKPVFAHWLSVFKFALCSQLSYERMALHLLAKHQPELTGVFLVANDPVSHTFWHFYEPEAFEGVDREKAARLGALVPRFYEHNDAYLGELLKQVDPDTVVMIVSDHGFQASGTLPKERPAPELFEGPEAARAAMEGVIAVGQSGKHSLDGVLIAAGGPIRKGIQASGTLYDVAPTVLALLGLPVPRDMEGRVLEEMIETEFLARHPVRRIASYESLIDRQAVLAAAEAGSEDDEEKKDLLRSLGYIQ